MNIAFGFMLFALLVVLYRAHLDILGMMDEVQDHWKRQDEDQQYWTVRNENWNHWQDN